MDAFTPHRRLALSSLAALAGWAWLQPALAAARDPAAEQFLQAEAQKVLTVLADRGLSKVQRDAAFRQNMDRLADFPRITGFVLGKYARTITPTQRQQFNAVFRTYAQDAYQTQLANFGADSIRVTGSVVRAPGDVVVNTVASGGGQALAVSWRLLSSGGAWKVVDVQAKGVWLAITLQQDFVSTIDNARGDIGVLIAQLERESGVRRS